MRVIYLGLRQWLWLLLFHVNICFGADDPCPPNRLWLVSGDIENHLYSDCHTSAHVLIRSPSPAKAQNSRLIIAWPAGASGVGAFFVPTGSSNSQKPLIRLHNQNGDAIHPIYVPDGAGGTPRIGVTGIIEFGRPTTLNVTVLGSLRAVRDYLELEQDRGGRVYPEMEKDQTVTQADDGLGVKIERKWFDGKTIETLVFTPVDQTSKRIEIDGRRPVFEEKQYHFEASINYPQLKQISANDVLNEASKGLLNTRAAEVQALSFLSYSDKLLAGTWRFLTYFGRDTMISLLLLQPILSTDAIEAGIGSVIERINKADGTVCHEEIIGDFASLERRNHPEHPGEFTDPLCDYKMIDTDFFLPVLLQNYILGPGKESASQFLNKKASFLRENKETTYRDLTQKAIDKILSATSKYAKDPKPENLIHLLPNSNTGNWRDSPKGLGGGIIPYDVNTALVPAALFAIVALCEAGHVKCDSISTIKAAGHTWEDTSLPHFRVFWSDQQAQSRIDFFRTNRGIVLPKPVNRNVTYYALAREGSNNLPLVDVMNSDDGFRLYLLDSSKEDLGPFLSQVADNVNSPWPVGLKTEAGLMVANPAYTGVLYFDMFQRSDYHGTVFWGWQSAMMVAGLGKQIGRCKGSDAPSWCADKGLYNKVVDAYDELWRVIEKNADFKTHEVWSWDDPPGKGIENMEAVPLNHWVSSPESNIRQLWSLAFLAVSQEKFEKKQ